MREQLVAKLRADRFTAMSGKMAAIVGYILDERFSEPAISEDRVSHRALAARRTARVLEGLADS